MATVMIKAEVPWDDHIDAKRNQSVRAPNAHPMAWSGATGFKRFINCVSADELDIQIFRIVC